jgi:CTP synthase (UTP-ammonia lyase)
MTTQIKIALIGDYHPEVKAHRAIPEALRLAARQLGCEVKDDWIETNVINGDAEKWLEPYDGVWCTPASPYVNMAGALEAIGAARVGGKPFLGTCGGCQHALLEYARNVLGLQDADHAETSPDSSVLFISPLKCELRDVREQIKLLPGSRAREIYAADTVEEEYNCGFGLNPEYKAQLEESGVRIGGVDIEGDARIFEFPNHPFSLATLFQPERYSLEGKTHPLVVAYLQAAMQARESRGSELETSTGGA